MRWRGCAEPSSTRRRAWARPSPGRGPCSPSARTAATGSTGGWAARSRCGRTSTGCARGECSRVREAAVVTARLGLLCGAMRAGGVRIGMGELLGAHRALRAVDASDRSAAYLAVRAAVCARHEDLEVFHAAWDEVFGRARNEQELALL